MRAKRVYVLRKEPLVLAGSFGTAQDVARMSGPLTFIYHNPGWIRPRNVFRWWLMARPFDGRNKRILFVTNENSEARWLRLMGLEAMCLGHNLHVRDQYFRPRPDASRDFEAVYTGRISPQKRLYLAAQVKRLCVITYEWGKGSWNLAASEPKLAHAVSNSTFLPEDKVRDFYQRSSCGLALSASEGAMWAAVEYLCCGLPIVTTPSRGGRDRYFDPAYVKTVPPDATAVAQAVHEWVQSAPSSQEIRNATLKKLHRDRIAFLEFLRRSCQLAIEDTEAEIARLWGGEDGIGRHGVAVGELGSLNPV